MDQIRRGIFGEMGKFRIITHKKVKSADMKTSKQNKSEKNRKQLGKYGNSITTVQYDHELAKSKCSERWMNECINSIL